MSATPKTIKTISTDYIGQLSDPTRAPWARFEAAQLAIYDLLGVLLESEVPKILLEHRLRNAKNNAKNRHKEGPLLADQSLEENRLFALILDITLMPASFRDYKTREEAYMKIFADTVLDLLERLAPTAVTASPKKDTPADVIDNSLDRLVQLSAVSYPQITDGATLVGLLLSLTIIGAFANFAVSGALISGVAAAGALCLLVGGAGYLAYKSFVADPKNKTARDVFITGTITKFGTKASLDPLPAPTLQTSGLLRSPVYPLRSSFDLPPVRSQQPLPATTSHPPVANADGHTASNSPPKEPASPASKQPGM